MDASAVSARLIGSFIVERGLLDNERLERALEEQQSTGRLLGDILVEGFGVTRNDLETALADQRAQSAELRDDDSTSVAMRELEAMLAAWGPAEEDLHEPPRKPIGQILIEQNYISPGQLDDALEQQRFSGRKLGEILLSSGKISRLRLWNALEAQAGSFASEGSTSPAAEAGESLRLSQDPVETPEVEKVAEQLSSRVERLEQEAGAEHLTVETLRRELGELAARLESTPAVSVELLDAVASTSAQVDQLTSGAAEAEAALRDIAYRIQANDNVIAAQSERLSEAVAAAASREQVDRLQGDLDDLRAAFSAQAAGPAESTTAIEASNGVAELRGELDALREALAIQQSPGQDWREAVAALAVRLDDVGDPSSEWRSELTPLLDRLRERVLTLEQERISEPTSSRVDELATRLEQRLGELAERTERVERGANSGLAQAHATFAQLRAELAAQPEAGGRTADLERRVTELEERLERAAREAHGRIDELSGAVGALPDPRDRIDAAFTRMDQLRSELEVLRETTGRLGAVPAQVERSEDRLDELSLRQQNVERSVFARVDELRAALDAFPDPGKRIDAAFTRIDELRTSVDELADPTSALAESSRRIDAALAGLGELRNLVEALPNPSETMRELSDRIDKRDARVAELREALAARPDPAERIDAAFARIDELRTAVEAIHDPADALAQLARRLEKRDARVAALRDVVESQPDHTQLLNDLAHRLERAETRSAAGLDELRDELGRALRSIPDPADRLDAAFSQIDELRTALAGLPAAMLSGLLQRMEATEAAFAEARARFESLEPVLLQPLVDRRPAVAAESTYLAFFPSEGGYRVVDCAGQVPSLGGLVELDGRLGMLRVARLGRSPLPLDDRPCAYLEPVSPATGS